jgi:hypothetical protein
MWLVVHIFTISPGWQMKSLLAALFISFGFCAMSAASAQACDIPYHTTSTAVTTALKSANGFHFSNRDAICEKLKAAHAELLIKGDATVLTDRSIAWADVSLKDKDLPISTQNFTGSATRTSADAGVEVAEFLLAAAIDTAIEQMNVDQALRALEDARMQIKRTYQQQR